MFTGPEESRDAKYAYCLKVSTAKVDWLCYERLPKKVFYGELQEGKRLETLQRHLQSHTEGFRHTHWALGTDCTGLIKVARFHKKGAAFCVIRESVKLKESAENAKPKPTGHQLIP